MTDTTKQLTDLINSSIEKINFNEVTDLSTLTTRTDGINLSNYPSTIQTIIQDILNKYLNNLPLNMKKHIIMAYLEQAPEATQEDLMAAVLLESGPIIQKLFQLIGQNTTSPTLKKMMTRLQDQLKPVDLSVSKPIIQEALGADFRLFAQATFKNLGAASIAQAILVTTPDHEEFIIKILKPGIAQKAEQEYDILVKKVLSTDAGKEKLTQIYQNIVDELDFRSEAKYLQQGHLIYQYCQGAGVITTPHIPKGNFVHKHVLVMSKAAGKSLSAFTTPDVQQTKLLALYQFYFLWLRESLFESGFFHGDTHAGNIFLNITNNKRNAFVLTPIDFGACAQLTKEQQSPIILLTLRLELRIPNFIAIAIKKLATNRYDEQALLGKLNELFGIKQEITTTTKTTSSAGFTAPYSSSSSLQPASASTLEMITTYAHNLLAKDRSSWGIQQKTSAFMLAQSLLQAFTELEKRASEPTNYKKFIEIIEDLRISLPAEFNLFMRGQRFLEQQINDILVQQKLTGEKFYGVLFSQLAKSQSPITAVPKFFSTFSKNMILNILMTGLQQYLRDMTCTIL